MGATGGEGTYVTGGDGIMGEEGLVGALYGEGDGIYSTGGDGITGVVGAGGLV